MAIVPTTEPARLPTVDEAPPAGAAPWQGFDDRLDVLSDWLSPILVKEARQSLKSMQFLVTFLLLLIAVWTWSLAPIEEGRGLSAGTTRLLGYCIILAFPLFVIVPFLAFRSFAAEREDGTYDLLTVTSLGPDQVVLGKLGSAVLQMLTYMSAVAPCIAFTYLLPGNDLPSIGAVLTTYTLTSIFLASLALALATASRNRYWQMLITVALVIVLLSVFIWSMALTGIFLDVGRYTVSRAAGLGEMTLFIAGYLVLGSVLALQAASARIASGGENYATRLRLSLAATLAWHVGVASHVAFAEDSGDSLLIMLLFAAPALGVAGALMMGETDQLPPRTKRGLPSSGLGRLVFSWLYPGAATGYFFILSCFAAVWLLTMAAWAISTAKGPMGLSEAQMFYFGLYLFVSLAFHLGLGRLLFVLLDSLRSRVGASVSSMAEWQLGPAEAFVTQLCLSIGLGIFGAFAYTLWDSKMALALFNPWAFVAEFPFRIDEFGEAAAWVSVAAAPLVLGQMIAARRAVLAERTAVPERVQEEDAPAPEPVAPAVHPLDRR